MTNESFSPIPKFSLFREIWNEARDRTMNPCRHPSYVVFFVLAVVGFSALGIWLELYVYLIPDPNQVGPVGLEPLRTAVLTFFPAAAGTAAMQLIWAESSKHFRSAATLVLFIFLVFALALFPSRVPNAVALSGGALATVFSLWIWWIANARQVDLLDKVDPTDAVGGNDPAAPLHGSLNDYSH